MDDPVLDAFMFGIVVVAGLYIIAIGSRMVFDMIVTMADEKIDP